MFKDITMTCYTIAALVFQMVKQMSYVNEKKKKDIELISWECSDIIKSKTFEFLKWSFLKDVR
jgi:hypothetical protein